jgi:hypothetical protein
VAGSVRHFVWTGFSPCRGLAYVYRDPHRRARRRAGVSAGLFILGYIDPGTGRLSGSSCHFLTFFGAEKVAQAANAYDAPDVG